MRERERGVRGRYERERERERAKERERAREKERKRPRGPERERERELKRVCVCVSEKTKGGVEEWKGWMEGGREGEGWSNCGCRALSIYLSLAASAGAPGQHRRGVVCV